MDLFIKLPFTCSSCSCHSQEVTSPQSECSCRLGVPRDGLPHERPIAIPARVLEHAPVLETSSRHGAFCIGNDTQNQRYGDAGDGQGDPDQNREGAHQ